MQLSKDFQLWEFTTSQTAQRHGIVNSPGEKAINNLKLLCQEILQPARDALGPIRVSSGYRSDALNAKVGGSSTSDHRFGYAADLIPLQCTKMQLARWIAQNCRFDQLILEFGRKDEPAWIHASNNPRGRKQILQILQGTGYLTVKL